MINRDYNYDTGICPVCKYDKLVMYEDATIQYEFNPITKEWDEQEIIHDDWMPSPRTFKCDNCEMEIQI